MHMGFTAVPGIPNVTKNLAGNYPFSRRHCTEPQVTNKQEFPWSTSITT